MQLCLKQQLIILEQEIIGCVERYNNYTYDFQGDPLVIGENQARVPCIILVHNENKQVHLQENPFFSYHSSVNILFMWSQTLQDQTLASLIISTGPELPPFYSPHTSPDCEEQLSALSLEPSFRAEFRKHLYICIVAIQTFMLASMPTGHLTKHCTSLI